MNLKQYPFLKFLIPLVLGILTTSYYFEFSDFYPFKAVFIAILLLLISLWIINSQLNYNIRWLWGIALSLFILFSASILTYSNYKQEFDNSLIIENKPTFYKVIISEPVEIKEKSVRTFAKVEANKNIKWRKNFINVLIYLEKDSLSEKLKYGDEIILYTEFQEIKKPQNPYQFNYKRYLANKKIFYQTYIKSGKWIKISSGNGNIIKSFALNLRQKLLNILEKNKIKGQEYAVISAVLLGQTDKIDPELYRTYVNSGAVHVLAVSGMHVGIIFLTLNTLLSFIDKFKNGKIFKSLILIIIIWFYALLTGLSPSVVRASTMITFIVIGKSLNRSYNIYNVICASAFILLLINPLLLFEIGFQLSFLAVAGIVIFHEELYKLWQPKNTIIDKLWSVTCISIAAQLTTGPISAFYFNQFPNYFLISNILVFLFSSLIIYAGILVLIFSFLSYVSNLMSVILVFLIKNFNYGLSMIEKLPFSTSSGINITLIEVALIYFLIFVIYFYFKNRNFINLRNAFIALIILQIFDISKAMSHNYQKKLIIYSLPDNQNIEFIKGNESFIFINKLIDKKTYDFNIKNNHIKSGLLKYNNTLINDTVKLKNDIILLKNKFFLFEKKRIVLIDKANFLKNRKLKDNNQRFGADLLIISNNSVFSIKELLKLYNPRKIIIDSTNKAWLADKLSRECEQLKMPYHNILQSGAFLMTLS